MLNLISPRLDWLVHRLVHIRDNYVNRQSLASSTAQYRDEIVLIRDSGLRSRALRLEFKNSHLASASAVNDCVAVEKLMSQWGVKWIFLNEGEWKAERARRKYDVKHANKVLAYNTPSESSTRTCVTNSRELAADIP